MMGTVIGTLDDRRRMARDWQVYSSGLSAGIFRALSPEELIILDPYDFTISSSGDSWALIAVSHTPSSSVDPIVFVALRPLEEVESMTLAAIAKHNLQIALSTMLLYLKRTGLEK